jgi:transcriptional regulator GlxA family with amidase domain
LEHAQWPRSGERCPKDRPATRDDSRVNRRQFLAASALAAGAGGAGAAFALTRQTDEAETAPPKALPSRPLPVPSDGVIRTAFAIGYGVNVIDLAGPWESFQDAAVGGGAGQFELFTVSGSKETVEASGRLAVAPTYSYDDAPQPNVVVIPAHAATPETTAWLRHVARGADLLMSVCTGAFVLADTGLLDGKTATTHHGSYDDFAASFPKVKLLRGLRFVEHDHVATAGGLTSGIDLALRVVERYLGAQTASATARYMEYSRRATRLQTF